jgi:hypothetical protein
MSSCSTDWQEGSVAENAHIEVVAVCPSAEGNISMLILKSQATLLPSEAPVFVLGPSEEFLTSFLPFAYSSTAECSSFLVPCSPARINPSADHILAGNCRVLFKLKFTTGNPDNIHLPHERNGPTHAAVAEPRPHGRAGGRVGALGSNATERAVSI